jgi:hypothetical protein
VSIPEDLTIKIARSLCYEINRAFVVLRQIGMGHDLKKFLLVRVFPQITAIPIIIGYQIWTYEELLCRFLQVSGFCQFLEVVAIS